MEKIGGASVIDAWYYTSTQYDETSAWVVGWNYGDKSSNIKTYKTTIRVVCAL